MKKKRQLVVVLACVLFTYCLLAACGKFKVEDAAETTEKTNRTETTDKNDTTEEGDTEVAEENVGNRYNSWFPFNMALLGDGATSGMIPKETTLDPEEVYSKIEYNEYLLYGSHGSFKTEGGEYDTFVPGDSFLENMSWKKDTELLGFETYYNADKYLFSVLPYNFKAGTAEVNFHLSKINDYQWCKLKFAVKNTETDELRDFTVDASYEVRGNELIIKPLSSVEGNEETGVVTYSFSGAELKYQFGFDGMELILAGENCEVRLLDESFYSYSIGNNWFSVDGSTAINPIPDIDTFELSYSDSPDNNAYFWAVYAPDNMGKGYPDNANMEIKIHDNGIIQFAFQDESGKVHSYEYVFFPLGGNGVAFSDGENNYIYLDHYIAYIEKNYADTYGLNVTAEDQEKLASLEEEDLKKLEETKENLLNDFAESLSEFGVGAAVDPKTGEILFDSSILFDKNESTVSAEGKEALINFSKVFSEVLQKEEYANLISQVVIQGHTDSDGDYDYNKTLSQQRADAVKTCIMDALADDATATALFESLFVTEGCSSDQLVYDENGKEDKDASRRVVFVFYVDPDFLDK
ncbi:MAG: OmpA family protein [Lachnospiraceae bacterium]|nr:OmpA family protein [Lachnospiraceae bacterium]